MTCPRCGSAVPDGARFCQACGAALAPAAEALPAPSAAAPPSPAAALPAPPVGAPAPGVAPSLAAPRFGGFWRRVIAFLIDFVLLTIAFMPFFFLFAIRALGMEMLRFDPTGPGAWAAMRELADRMRPATAAFGVLMWLYYALMESTRPQATIGKLVVGARLTDLRGQRVSFWRATLRFAVKYVCLTFFFPLLVVVAFTPRKQGLHDLIARTLVITR